MITDFVLEVPFDQYARYRDLRHVVDFLIADDKTASHVPSDFSILDIGGLFHPLSGGPYLPIQLFFDGCLAVAIDRTMPRSSIGMMVQSDGISLPFRDHCFHWVNASDVVEHVPIELRGGLMREMLRCSRGYLSLSSPVGNPEVNLAEEFVLAYLRRVMKIEHQALNEHRTMTLPAERDLKQIIAGIDPALHMAVLPSGNLYRWIFMMISRHLALATGPPHGVNREMDRFYNLHCYASDHRKPVYRHLYVIGYDSRILDLENYFCGTLFPEINDYPHSSDVLLMDLLSRIEDQERWLRLTELQANVHELQEKNDILNREVAESQAETEGLRREIHALSQIWTVRLWQRLKGII